MTAEIRQFETAPGPGRMATPQLRTLVVCDIADSTALVERMGDQNAANIIRKHDRLARALVEQHRGREIDKTDGFLLMFERPIQAAAFALDYQRGLKHMSAAEGVVVRARVGIHMGDVVIWENAPEDVSRGAKPTEVEGLVKPVAARLAQLARPQQILVSSAAAGIAHRAAGELGAKAAERVHWKTHGRYRFKGLPEAIEVVEVGEDEVAPLHAPKSVRTAKRILPWWRRPLTLTAEAAMLLIGIGAGTWFLLQSPPTLAFGARDWVVVGNLHNLTDDKLYDQSVDSALRISLEQSQYVNVLPELSVQQTLQRMQLNPDNTDVNRAIGSQVALREGARAMILPTVADVGGRVRVTAEVIDPNTQATVYSVSADGIGAQSVLPSLDSVSKQLRGKLGEALAMVSKQSQPLAQVATPDLNALKAYSLGERAYDKGDLKDAETYFNEALRIDPHFALARMALARIDEAEGKLTKAFDEIRVAQSDHDRLSARDALYVDAWASTYLAPKHALEKWKLLASVYPDYYTGISAYAYFLWKYANRFNEAIPYLQQSTTHENPNRAASETMLGTLYIEQGRFNEALRMLEKAAKNGMQSQNVVYSLAYAAQRKFSDAAHMVEHERPSDDSGQNISSSSVRITMAVDRGDLRLADNLLRLSIKKSQAQKSSFTENYEIMQFSVDALRGAPKGKQIAALSDYLSRAEEKYASVPLAGRAELKFKIVLVAYFAAHAGDVALAKKAIAAVGDESDIDTPVLDNMLSITKAEIERASGRSKDAAATLISLVNGSELYITHVALMDAYADASDYTDALAEAHWLSSHRGRAYAEHNMNLMLMPFNVASSDLALLRAAEFSQVLGKKAGIRQSLAALKKAWPGVMQIPWITRRLRTIHEF
jgi:putative peptide modification system cyclase